MREGLRRFALLLGASRVAMGPVSGVALLDVVHLALGVFISPTHKRTTGLAPVFGSEFTRKAAHYRGDSGFSMKSLLG